MKNNDKGIVVAIDGPSGVGKDTVMRGIIAARPKLFEKAASYTTREMRPDESQGNPYFFITPQDFHDKLEKGLFFEHTTRHGTMRAMSKQIFDCILQKGKIPLKDCDKVGVLALKKLYGKRVFGIFITAPKEVVASRLQARGESGESFATRIKNYDQHMLQKKYYDVCVENISLEQAISDCISKIEHFYGTLKI